MRRAANPRWLATAICVAVVAGCGETTSPNVDEVPLAPGLRVVVDPETCSVSAYTDCSYDATIEAPLGMTEPAMMASERRTLARRGWRPVAAADAGFVGAESPNRTVDVFLATQARQLQYERQQGLLARDLRDPDLGPVLRRVLANTRVGRRALVATLELGAEPGPRLQQLTGVP